MTTSMPAYAVLAIAALLGVIGFMLGWWAGRSYGETEAETRWLRRDAERQVKAAQMPRDEVFVAGQPHDKRTGRFVKRVQSGREH